MSRTHEHKRLQDPGSGPVPQWQKWGPYVAERAWGTVREDYSDNGDCWSYFPHDEARFRTYRWGEDGIAGWCDRYQTLIFAPAFWNGKDPFLKERHFGLNFWEGNHGEDVKECYYYVDGTPTHSYMKYLYKYPQERFPYEKLREENKNRNTFVGEYELIDTGVFSENRYFDIYIEYAKASPEDICIKIEVFNRGPEDAPLHILPHLWFRNQWSWTEEILPHPQISQEKDADHLTLVADEKLMHPPANLPFEYKLGLRYLYAPKGGMALFTRNETRKHPNDKHAKDAFHRAVVNGENCCIAEGVGTKACIHYFFPKVPSKGSVVLYLRLSDKKMKHPLEDVEKSIQQAKKEADEFYKAIQPEGASEDEKRIQRQAIAGVLWSKQFYLLDVNQWLLGDHSHHRPPASRAKIRNFHWKHLNSMRVLLMPDKWEYPWFAAWDHAFHCLTLGLVDIQQAKEQLWLLLFDQFQHPSGQIPAYEWEFSDMNPPVQAWAALTLANMEEKETGKKDYKFLKRCFHKLLLNFAWWVNKVDKGGYNVFEGGFLGLDNITIIDRSLPVEEGERVEQSDGTGWMAFFCLGLMRMALELAREDNTYESLATKFFQHFVYIAHAMKKRDERPYELWSEKDGFFYDVIRYSQTSFVKLRIRSLVGLIPLYAVDVITKEELDGFPEFARNFYWFNKNKEALTSSCVHRVFKQKKEMYVLSLVDLHQLRKVLNYVWNPDEFRANFGLRSLSKYHQENPFIFRDKAIGYEPAESFYRIKGGNSNWRGPIWFPTTYLLIQSLRKFADVYDEDIHVQVKDEEPVSQSHIAHEFAEKLISIFKKNSENKRPVNGLHFPFHEDENWADLVLFYEYYHPETGQGLGASHQTGWSALVANLIQELRGK